jgi:Trypsin-like peptidase domain/Effector-associated domain 1
MDWEKLNGPQRKLLRQTILAAYVNEQAFDIFLAEELEKPSLANFAGGATFEQRVFSLIGIAQAEGWTRGLVAGIQQDRPGNPLISSLPDVVRMAGADAPSRLGERASGRTSQGLLLEKIVRGGGFVDLRIWAEKLANIAQSICRIEFPAGQPRGTGILVSSELVLTNYHVVEQQIAGGADPSEIVCRFDFARDTTGVDPGTPACLVTGTGWKVVDSPYDAAADVSGAGVAKPNCLDFALLHLSGSTGATRTPVSLSGQAPTVDIGFPIFVVQHPKGSPMALALGVSMGTNENGVRLRYDTDTMEGSSGSGVFNQNLELVALHHAGDPAASIRAKYNQGIPVAKIVGALGAMEDEFKAKGVQKFWR